MLTKEERAGIAERIKRYDSEYDPFYYILFGYPSSCDMPYEEYKEEILNRIFNLCDVSNMVELPLDKDGEVIHIGDVVYDNEGREWRANSLVFYDDAVTVEVRYDYLSMVYRSDILSHKQSAKNSVLAEQIRDVVRSAISMPTFAAKRLSRIADQLESLGDSDD